MISIIYKRLFELRIIHEYYLFQIDGQSYFDLSDDAAQRKLLKERVDTGQYDLSKNMSIVPTETTQRLMKNYHLRLATSPTGFFVGVQVNVVEQEGGGVKYFPLIPIPKGLNLIFRLVAKHSHWNSISNLPFQLPLATRYYFSNANEEEAKIFPALSLPIAAFKATRFYRMGELALFNGIPKEAVKHTDLEVDADWRQINGSGFASDADSMLLPRYFTFHFDKGRQVKAATFRLKNKAGDTVKEIITQQTSPLGSVALDFREGDKQEVPFDFYQLEVETDTAYQFEKAIYLNDDLYDTNTSCFAVLVLQDSVADSEFRLLDEDGALKTQLLPGNSRIPHPVFELRIKSRSAYWRYRSAKNLKLGVGSEAQPYLVPFGKDLITKHPRYLSASPTVFSGLGLTNEALHSIYLPNPTSTAIREVGDAVMADIYVSSIKGKITELN